jgi:hypothetical protein
MIALTRIMVRKEQIEVHIPVLTVKTIMRSSILVELKISFVKMQLKYRAFLNYLEKPTTV